MIPDPHNCTLDAQPPPPPPIGEVAIVSESIEFGGEEREGQLDLDLVWNPPSGVDPVFKYTLRVVEGTIEEGEIMVADVIYVTDIVVGAACVFPKPAKSRLEFGPTPSANGTKICFKAIWCLTRHCRYMAL